MSNKKINQFDSENKIFDKRMLCTDIKTYNDNVIIMSGPIKMIKGGIPKLDQNYHHDNKDTIIALP